MKTLMVVSLVALAYALEAAPGPEQVVIPRNEPVSVTGKPKAFAKWFSAPVAIEADGLCALTFSGSRLDGSGGCVLSGVGPVNVDLRGVSPDWNVFQDLMMMPHERPKEGFKVHFGLWNCAGLANFDGASVTPLRAEYRTVGDLALGHGEALVNEEYSFQSAYSSKSRNHSRVLAGYGGGTRFNTDRWVLDQENAFVTYRHELSGRTWGAGAVTLNCNWHHVGEAAVEVSADGATWRKVAAVAKTGVCRAELPADVLGGAALFVRLRAEKRCALQVNSYVLEAKSVGPKLFVQGSTRYLDARGAQVANIKPSSYFDTDYGALVAQDAAAAVWTASSGRKIPRARALPEARAACVRVQLAANEAEAVQAVVRAGEPLSGLRARAEVAIPGAKVETLCVGYVNVQVATDAQGCRGLWPDPLFADGEPVSLAAEENQPFWVRVTTGKDTPKGVYRGTIVFSAVRANGAAWRREVPFEVEVFGFAVPERNTIATAFGFARHYVKTYQKLNTQEAFDAVIGKYLRCFADHRLSLYDPTGGRVKFKVTWKNLKPDPMAGEPVFDWADWDAKMTEGIRDYRMTAFRIRIEGLGGGNFASRVEPKIAGIPEGHPAYETLLARYLRGVESHLREKGWLEMAYVYWFDEPDPKDYEFVMNGFRKIHRHAPGLRTMLTEQPERTLAGGPSIWCPQPQHLASPVTEERRKAGDEMWWYICCGPKAPYVGEFIDHPGTDLRVWLWQTWKENVTGVLIWDTAFWHSGKAYPGKGNWQNPYEDPMSWCSAARFKDGTRIPWGNGDGRFLYPPRAAADGRQQGTVLDGPVVSLRLELLRDGIEDYEYLALLKRRLAAATGLSAAERAACEALLVVPDEITKSLVEYTEDPTPIERRREQIARALERLACEASDGVVVENAALRVTCAAAEEGFGIRSVENRSGGARFVNPSEAKAPRWRVEEHENCGVYLHDVTGERAASADFWELEFRAIAVPGDRSQAVFVDNRSACRRRRVERRGDGATFVWEGVKLPDGELDVRARIRFAADGSSRWTLSTDVRSTRFALFAKHFPFFRHVVRPGEGDVLLPRADVGARLYVKADYDPSSSRAYGCLAYVPMMTAFMIGDSGLYIAAHDERACAKSLVVTGERDVAFHSCVPDDDFEVTVSAFRGDWWAAARLYRRWALTAPWCRKGRILDRADYPRRICEIPLWFNFHGDAAAASNALAKAKALFPDVTAGLHWHRWQAVPWEIGHYPEYFPEGPGVKDCLRFCRALGQEPMLYTLPRLYSQTLLSFHFAEPAALRRPDGTYVVERYGRPEGNPPPLVPLCPAVKAWQDCTVDYARRILALGGTSVFLDQFASCPARACYAEGHGHRPGGGDWFYRGQHAICERVHADYAAAGAFVTAEGSSDAFIDVVDGFLGVTPRAAEDVPFLHAVYNGYTTYFCSPENHEDDDDSFWALQARETLWGQSLGWYHTLLMEHPAKVALVRKLVAFRQRNLDCFAYGELLGDVAFEGDRVPRIRTTWLGRKSFPDWADPKAELSPTTYGEMPGVLGYEWKSGTTGRTCAIVGNLTNASHPVAFRFGGRCVRLTLAPRELKRINEGSQFVYCQ